MHRFIWILVLTLLSAAAACASGGGGASPVYRRDIGNASFVDALSRSELVLARSHYEILNLDTIPFIRIETHWRPRPPFADEQTLGITEAESRVIVTARVRGETDIGSVYNVQMTVENRVRLAGGPDWNERTNTPMFREYADDITTMFKTEFVNIGVRRY